MIRRAIFTVCGLLLAAIVIVAGSGTCLADPPDSGEVVVTVDVPSVMALYLRKNAFSGTAWTGTSTTLTFDDYQAGMKELLFGSSPNPTGRLWWQTNTPAHFTIQLAPGGNFASGGLELWVKRLSAPYIKAVAGSPTFFANAAVSQSANYQISFKIDKITWAQTHPGTYSETLVFTIQEP